MYKFYSKVEPKMLLHIIHELDDFNGRNDIIPEENFLQCSSLRMGEGATFKPHKHIEKTAVFNNHKAQESWVVIRGAVKCIFYDIDDTILVEKVLKAGEASITLHGGHNYVILEDDTLVYEFKTGPYFGQAMDKKFIDAKS